MAITNTDPAALEAALGKAVAAFAKQGTTIFYPNYKPSTKGARNPWLQLFSERQNDWVGLPGPTKTFYESMSGYPYTSTSTWGQNELPRKRGGYLPYEGTAQPPFPHDYVCSIAVAGFGSIALVTIIPQDTFTLPWKYTLLVSDTAPTIDSPKLRATLRYITTGTIPDPTPIAVGYHPPSGAVPGDYVMIKVWTWQENQYRTDQSLYQNIVG